MPEGDKRRLLAIYHMEEMQVLALALVNSDVRAGLEALKPAEPGPQKPEPAQALARAREGSGPGLG